MSRAEVASRERQVVEKRRRKRRRPSGEPPPLPRDLKRSGRMLLWSIGTVALILVAVGLIEGLGGNIEEIESRMIRAIAKVRTPFLTTIAQVIERVFDIPTISVLRWATLVVLLAYKRFRHLFVYLGTIFAVGFLTTTIGLNFVRGRPLGVDIIGDWQGSAMPSRPVAALCVTLLGVIYSLIVPGRPRDIAKWVAFAAIFLFAATRLYLAVDHPMDLLVAMVLGVGIPVAAFRWLTPNEVFPVTYQRGRTAHLDIEGPRGEAIRRAVRDQLGIEVVDMKPFGLGGSAGSTPMRLEVEGGAHRYLFAKLYAANHLRADRWYKLGRTLLYGRLEDETAFSTVRRLVQYEDYLLHLMKDTDVNAPRPYGFVEITPEREYVIVMEMIEGAEEMLDREVTDEMIRNGLREVRKLWQAGLAHRDIKPSNVLVKGEDVYLIDVAFGEARPSPWREAVDLANMMLVLGLGAEPERVYGIATEIFTPDEIAEAFAATQRVTMPSQSRQMLKKTRRDLVSRFRELAPDRKQVSIQRWSYRRLALTVAALLSLLIAVGLVTSNLRGAGLTTPPEATQGSFALVVREPHCRGLFGLDPMGLMAQSVPSAAYIPCTTPATQAWDFHSMDVRKGRTKMFFDSAPVVGEPGSHELIVVMQSSCATKGQEVPSGHRSISLFEDSHPEPDAFTGVHRYIFEGGCVELFFDLEGDDWPNFVSASSLALDFRSRASLNAEIQRLLGWGEEEEL